MVTIRWESLGPLLVTALAVMGSPGPATVSLTAAGSAFGVRRSLGYMIGIVAGTMLVLVAVAAGITAAVLAVPALRALLIVVSAAYILWLAYHVATTAPPAARTAGAAPPSLIGGTLLGAANPKAWVALTAVFTSARLADTAMADAAAKVAVLSAMAVLILTGWLLSGASLARLLRDRGRARIFNSVLAAALVGATAYAILR
ncbi:MAG TPA: LysE family transporter [Actinomycetes bacterium]|nr:LysE family transporter [Actinomycetes bacterium]